MMAHAKFRPLKLDRKLCVYGWWKSRVSPTLKTVWWRWGETLWAIDIGSGRSTYSRWRLM